MVITRARANRAAAKAVSTSREKEKRRKSAARTREWRKCQSEERQSEIWQTDWTRRAEGCACPSAERLSEIRQTNWTGHASHVCQRSNMERIAHIISIYYCWIISLLILYLLSCITRQDNNWKTLSFTCSAQQQVDNTATKPKKVTAKPVPYFEVDD